MLFLRLVVYFAAFKIINILISHTVCDILYFTSGQLIRWFNIVLVDTIKGSHTNIRLV